jgi:hypothetical protein
MWSSWRLAVCHDFENVAFLGAQDILAQVYKCLPTDLSKNDTASLKQDVCKACDEILALNKTVLGQRVEQADTDVLQQAVQQGLVTFQAFVEALADASAAAKKACSLSNNTACVLSCAGMPPPLSCMHATSLVQPVPPETRLTWQRCHNGVQQCSTCSTAQCSRNQQLSSTCLHPKP